MAEVTATGFQLKTQNEYFAEEQALYVGIDPNWNLDPSTPDGLKIAHDSEIFGNLDEVLLAAYNSKDPNRARDLELDIVSALTGTFRNLGNPSTAIVALSGVPGTIVPVGTIIESTVNASQWATDAALTIPVSGVIDAAVTATVRGATEAGIGDITRIVDTVGGLQSATNAAVATLGTNAESNGELRLRRALSVGRPGNNQIDSMLGEIGATAGVRRFVILENDTNATDANGLPAHSIAPIVDGGTDAAVALSIYLKKNPGVLLYAAATSVSETVTSPLFPANTKQITFSRPLYVDAVVVVDVVDDGTLPGNAEDLIKQAIVDYSGGDLIAAECGFNVLGFDIGEDVHVSRLYTPVNQVIGQHGNSYISGLTVNGQNTTVPVAFNELSRWSSANVTVNIT